jgi:hypothetical protein
MTMALSLLPAPVQSSLCQVDDDNAVTRASGNPRRGGSRHIITKIDRYRLVRGDRPTGRYLRTRKPSHFLSAR